MHQKFELDANKLNNIYMWEIEQEVKKLREELNKLHFEFTQFFRGNRKDPPLKEKGEFERKLRELSRKKFFTHAPRYLVENLVASYTSYSSLWERIMRQIEEGKYERGKGWVPKHEISAIERGSAVGTPVEDPYERIIAEYVEMKRISEGKPIKIDREKFKEKLKSAEEMAKEKYGCKEVEFKVVVEGGSVKVKAIPKA